ncbi:CBS domain-containing protein [Candidatus Bathyarchaeota archaeon]|nr:CBS domain-containing protein [Candidatus Bathyarchaeota archaeon]
MVKTLEELVNKEINDLIDKRISIFDPKDNASKVLGELKQTDRYEAVVSSGSKVGIITVRDLLDIDQPSQTRLEGFWRPLTPVSPNVTLGSVASILIKSNIRALPILETKKVTGIISQNELINSLLGVEELKKINVKDHLKAPVISLDVSEKVSQARRIMLEKGFSHIPITQSEKLVGIITAKDIVHAFITPIEKISVGSRVTQKVNKFPGNVKGVMDSNPCTVNIKASIFDVVNEMIEYNKSACVIVDDTNSVLGVITPRELLPLIAISSLDNELPVYILGLSKEDFIEKSIVEEKVRKIVTKNLKIHPDIAEVSIKIKKQQASGDRARYKITARVISPSERFSVDAEDWGLIEVFDKLLNNLDDKLKQNKRDPKKRFRRKPIG